MIEKSSQILCDQELLKYETYEDYLESLITPRDLFHLRSKVLARQIIELGYHTEGTLERETFYHRVKTIKRNLYLMENPYALCSESIEPDDVLLAELALRENANRIGDTYTIIFMRHFGKCHSQISGFIDYSYRLKSEDWKPYFESSKTLIPRKSDLSYYNWKTGTSILNQSPNFKPISDGESGLVFQNIHDDNFITVHPALTLESNPARVAINSEMYGDVVLYDYNIVQTDDDSNKSMIQTYTSFWLVGNGQINASSILY